MLEDSRVIELFRELNRIPRASGNPEGISAYLMEFGEKLGLESQRDEWYNVILRKPASPGWEDLPGLILQSHMDMVCVKDEGVEHDFNRDPIPVIADADGWLRAAGTTLGADDGLGMALCLAVLEDGSLPHPPIECVFTSEEETNMEGARNLDKSVLRGTYFINLDQEDDTAITVSSAGIADTRTSFALADITQPYALPDGMAALRITVEGLLGGHSGIDIHLKRRNAILLLLECFVRIQAACGGACRILQFSGGTHMNSIPQSAEGIASVPETAIPVIGRMLEKLTLDTKAQWGEGEPNIRISWERVGDSAAVSCYTEKAWHGITSFLYLCPHGVLAMDPELDGLVETSANLARIVTEKNRLTVWVSIRSSRDDKLDDLVEEMRTLGGRWGGVTTVCFQEYGWPRREQSRFVPFLAERYREVYHRDPLVFGIHAGLECGTFSRSLPEGDLVSMGPTLRHPHTTGERADMLSLERFTRFLNGVLERFDSLRTET